MPALAGQTATADQYNEDVQKLIGFGQRLSNSSTTTTEIGVLRLDDIPILAGHRYEISTSTLLLGTSVANDIVTARLRYTTDGSTPSTSSTLLTLAGERIEVTASGGYALVRATYAPAADETLSVLLTVGRASGTGNVGINYGSAAPIEVYVIDLGEDPGDTGVDI